MGKNNKKLTQEEFIKRVKNVNPYIQVMGKYINNQTAVKCRCKKCGFPGEKAEWNPTPQTLWKENACPICSGKQLTAVYPGYNDLLSQRPDLAAEWDYDLNEGKRPNEVSIGSHEDAYWKCPKGHPSYQARIANRVYKNDGCPVCSNRVILVGYNDLATVYPFVAAQWDYKQNYPKTPQQVFPREGNEYYWICPICGQSYKALVSNRTAGKGHKQCSKIGTSFQEQAIYYYVRKICPDATNRDTTYGFELDVYIPSSKIAIEFDGKGYHDKEDSLIKDNKKDALCIENGINLYRVRDPSLPSTESATRITCEEKGRVSIQPAIEELISILSAKKEIDVNVERDYFDILETTVKDQKKRSIIYTHPKIAAEWHPTKNLPLKPEYITAGMAVDAWWYCDKHHKAYRQLVYSRKAGHGCPECRWEKMALSHIKTSGKKNNLYRHYPELIKEFDQALNPGVNIYLYSAGSGKEIIWRCSKCGKTFPAKINKRTGPDKTGCPNCGREQTRKAACRGVINLDTGETFESLKAAAESCGGNKKNICSCCRERIKTAYGYHWAYLDPKDNRKRFDYNRLIKNIDTGEVFPNITAAAQKYGCDRSSISSALRGKTNTSQGCRWTYIEKP